MGKWVITREGQTRTQPPQGDCQRNLLLLIPAVNKSLQPAGDQRLWVFCKEPLGPWSWESCGVPAVSETHIPSKFPSGRLFGCEAPKQTHSLGVGFSFEKKKHLAYFEASFLFWWASKPHTKNHPTAALLIMRGGAGRPTPKTSSWSSSLPWHIVIYEWSKE